MKIDKTQILQILDTVCPSIDFEISDQLITDGYLDSMSVMSIMHALSESYNIQFGFEDITIENFNSIDNIQRLLERHLSSL